MITGIHHTCLTVSDMERSIEAATALFAERPSGHVTVRDIAERADVNHALVHRSVLTVRRSPSRCHILN